jgi:hypothetical protein
MDNLSSAARRQPLPNGLGEIQGCDDLRRARDVVPGERWAFVEHQTMAKVVAAERQP